LNTIKGTMVVDVRVRLRACPSRPRWWPHRKHRIALSSRTNQTTWRQMLQNFLFLRCWRWNQNTLECLRRESKSWIVNIGGPRPSSWN